ncbi:ABC transporter permease [Lactobacillus ultunensis]|uniref:ABC transporter permease n=1 Tax=Lactobacillus ultunensis TaxID=227945 RepID=UPI0019133E61|nr:FtsX-like permease family protein [Lactobacillus ultunensis]QQP28472.1 FtsX-like permease family protein [Lactobacillus ultunensis]
MRKTILWKDALQAITHSLGRYIAIILLIGLGTFAFVGLKMAGPDMRATGADFFAKHNLADVTVMSNYGINSTDRVTIQNLPEVKETAFGYFQDVKIKNSSDTLRVFSQSNNISSYQLMKGHFPDNKHEIALSYLLKKKYRLGQKISFAKPGILKNHTYKIVGFVKSSEFLDKNQIGQTSIGDGRLTGIAITSHNAFASPVYQVSRVTFKNTANLSPFSVTYRNRVYRDQQKLQDALNENRKDKYDKYVLMYKTEYRKKAAQQLLKRGIPINPNQIKVPKNKIKIPYPSYTISGREESQGYSSYRADSERVEVLANVFPVFLFAVAALVSLTTMMRFVEEERTNIGTLKALGYSNGAIAIKFLLYSTSAAILGVIGGSILGYTFLPDLIIKAYLASSTLGTGYQLNFAWMPLLISLVVALLSTTVVSMFTLWQTLREQPAALLLPKPPKNGSRILLERIPWLWRHMSFSAKVTARNIFRYKSRMLMTILGVAGCTGLLVMGFGIRDSLQGIGNIQYNDLQKNDVIALKSKDVSKNAQKELDDLFKEKAFTQTNAVQYQQLTKLLKSNGSIENIMLIAPQNTTTFRKSINLRQRQDKKKLILSDNGVIISEKLATILHAKRGSSISLKNSNGKTYRFKVNGICEMYLGHYIFMSPREYEKTMGKKYAANAYLVTMKKHDPAFVNKVSQKLVKTAAIETVVSNSSNRSLLGSFTGSLNEVIFILILISGMLAVVVIYNLTNINVAERIRELSTIKVLGFYDNETTMYIYRETIILSILGIIVGFGFGWWLHHFIIISLPPDVAMFDPNMYPLNFVCSALIPAIITAVLAIVVHHKIKRINMLDALSSID